jgi:hypothetical protein
MFYLLFIIVNLLLMLLFIIHYYSLLFNIYLLSLFIIIIYYYLGYRCNFRCYCQFNIGCAYSYNSRLSKFDKKSIQEIWC